jgi:hypothetical protein
VGTFRFKSDLRNHQAIVQPRLCDCLMVTQITLLPACCGLGLVWAGGDGPPGGGILRHLCYHLGFGTAFGPGRCTLSVLSG